MTSSHSVKKETVLLESPECSIACRKVISDLKRPGLAVGRVRKNHLGKISRKRSEVVPTYDAQLPGVPGGPDSGNNVPSLSDASGNPPKWMNGSAWGKYFVGMFACGCIQVVQSSGTPVTRNE